VRIAPIIRLPGLLVDMDVDPAPLMAEVGLDPAIFEDPENCVGFADAGRLLALCAERTDCPHFGVLLGRNLGLDVLGAVGELAGSSPDLGSALRNIILYLHLHDRGAIPFLSASNDCAMLSYVVYQPDIPGTAVIYDLTMAISCNILRTLAGPNWKATQVRLCRPPPADTEPYREFFQAPVHFRTEHSELVFATSWLDFPLGGANALVHQRIIGVIEALEARGAGNLATQIRRMLHRLLIGGACQADTCLGQIASMFGIHQRTMNRRLRAQGTTFKILIDEARYDVARRLLRETRMPVVEVAASLDYADSAAFNRAFRRWSGMTPTAWRDEHPPL